MFWNLFLTILKFKRYVKKKLLLDALLYWKIVLIDTKLLICVKKVVDAYPMILRYICYWFVRPEMSKVLYNENFHFNDPYEHFTWHDEHNQHKACKKLLYKESKLIAWNHKNAEIKTYLKKKKKKKKEICYSIIRLVVSSKKMLHNKRQILKMLGWWS